MRFVRVVLLLLPLASLAALPVASAAATAPAISLGDSWTLVTQLPEGQGDVESTSRVAGFETIAIGGQTLNAIRYVSEQSTTQGSPPFAVETSTVTTTWSRYEDGATLKLRTETTTLVPNLPASVSIVETTYAAPCASYKWPLEVGNTWATTCESTTSIDSGAGALAQPTTTESSSTWVVTGTEQVTVPAGTFAAYVIEQTSDAGVTTTQWYAPSACHAIKTQTPSGLDVTATQLASYQCARANDVPATSTAGGSAGGETSGGNDGTATSGSTGESGTEAESGGSTGAGDGGAPSSASSGGSPTTTSGDAGSATRAAGTPAGAAASDESPADTPGPGLVIVVAAVGIAAVAFARARRDG